MTKSPDRVESANKITLKSSVIRAMLTSSQGETTSMWTSSEPGCKQFTTYLTFCDNYFSAVSTMILFCWSFWLIIKKSVTNEVNQRSVCVSIKVSKNMEFVWCCVFLCFFCFGFFFSNKRYFLIASYIVTSIVIFCDTIANLFRSMLMNWLTNQILSLTWWTAKQY
jgi:hypothetical protein